MISGDDMATWPFAPVCFCSAGVGWPGDVLFLGSDGTVHAVHQERFAEVLAELPMELVFQYSARAAEFVFRCVPVLSRRREEQRFIACWISADV